MFKKKSDGTFEKVEVRHGFTPMVGHIDKSWLEIHQGIQVVIN